MILKKLGISRAQVRALIGGIIIKFSTAVITCWGNINLYFLSAFHYQGSKITPQTNSIILILSVPVMLIAMLFAIKLCNKFGFELVIRLASFLFFFTPLVNILIFNLILFVLFSILVPSSMYALISVPVLNCIWTHFPDSKNKITSILVIAFGLGTLTWNFLFMHMINPLNQNTLQVNTEDTTMQFFSQKVTQNVRFTAIIGFIVTGLLAIFGSLLLTRHQLEDETLQQQKEHESNLGIQQQIGNNAGNPTSQTLQQSQRQTKERAELTYGQALKDERFIHIMVISTLTGFYQIYLMMNFKIIFMPVVADDHFLSYASMICSIVSICGAFFWGFLGDYKGIYFTVLLLSFLDLGGKIFSDFAQTKTTIFIMMVLVGLISKSMITITGPGFVEIFGLKLGTQLLPLKGVAIILGYILVPLLHVLTSKLLTPRQYLVCLSFFSIITVSCALRLSWLKWRQVKLKTQDQGKRKKQNKDQQIKQMQLIDIKKQNSFN